MLIQCHLAQLIIVFPAKTLIRGQRHLGINDHILVIRQMDDHVRLPALPGFRGHRHLGLILTTTNQPGFFQNPFKNHLPPVALCFGLTFQRISQVTSILNHFLVELLQISNLLQQCCLLTVIVAVNLIDPTTEVLQLLTEWLEHIIQPGTILLLQLQRALLEYFCR